MKNKFILFLSGLVFFAMAGKAQTIGPILGSSIVCVGSTVTVSDTTHGGTWSLSPAGVATISASGVVTGIAVGTGTISYVVGTGTVLATISVATSTVTAGTITGSSSVCPMTAITLTDPTGTSGGSWYSSSGRIASVSPASGVVEGLSAGTVNISYVVSSSCGLFSTYTPVTVYPMPVIGALSATADVCIGSNDTFTFSPAGGTWRASNPLVGTVAAGVVTSVSAGIDSIFYTVSTPCGITTSHFVVIVQDTPATSIITGSTDVCTGAMITLSDTASGGTWSAYNSNATVSGSGVVTGVSTGTDSIFYSVTNACSTKDTFIIVSVVSSTVTGGAVIGSDVLSASYSIALTDPTGPTGGTWYSSAPGIASVSASGVVRGILPGTVNISYGLSTSCGIFSAYQPVMVYPYPVIPIQLYYDRNTDCIFDSGDTYLTIPETIVVDSNGVTIDTITATAGLNYTVYGGHPGDIYGFRVISSSFGLYAACPSGTVYDTLYSGFVANTLNIGFRCATGSEYDFAVNPIIFATGPYDQYGHVYLSNTTCYSPGSSLIINYSHKCVFTGGYVYPGPSSYTDSTITWDLSGPLAYDSLPIDIHYQIWYNPAIGLMTIGDTIHTTFTINPISGDLDTLNNTITVIDTVKAGCDPNEMWVNPICLPSGDTSRSLTYTINFMNTGNDTAYNIYILDTLSHDLDPLSLRIIMSSNKMFVTKYNDSLGETIFRFDYPGINLLDSSYHNLCDGGLVFSINTLPALATGTSIANRAGIYFDNNAVVMTNTVITQDGGCIPTGIAASPISSKGAVNLYPNPAGQTLIIEADALEYNSAIINNVLGKEVMTITLSGTSTNVDVSELQQGVYFLEVGSGNKREVRMFVKL